MIKRSWIKLIIKTLPDSLQKKNKAELEAIINQKSNERSWNTKRDTGYK